MNLKQYIRSGISAADITPLLGNTQAFHDVIDALAKWLHDKKITKVICIEGRGFLFGSAVAYKMNLGIIPVRTEGKLQQETYAETYTDYSGKEKILEIHKDNLSASDVVGIIDDWIETGETIFATINLIEKCGAKVGGISVLMDDSTDVVKTKLEKYSYSYILKRIPDDTF